MLGFRFGFWVLGLKVLGFRLRVWGFRSVFSDGEIDAQDYIGKFLDCFPAYPKEPRFFVRSGLRTVGRFGGLGCTWIPEYVRGLRFRV